MPSRRSSLSSPLLLKNATRGWPVSWFRHKREINVPAVDFSRSPVVQSNPIAESSEDFTSLLSDELLQRILSLLSPPAANAARLVSRRWLALSDQTRKSLTVLDWSFLDSSSRLASQFPSLTEVDLVAASFDQTVGVVVNGRAISAPVAPAETVDRGLDVLARGCPNLRKLSVVAAGSPISLMKLAECCVTLQELELYYCSDQSLRAISVFQNLQVLKLEGSVWGVESEEGLTDVGLTILAHGCRRLVKLELSRCSGGDEGIAAVGRCCPMLEELTIHDHRMAAGWMAGLSSWGNLKVLRIQGCRQLDGGPETRPDQLESCTTIERLCLQRCQIRDRRRLASLLLVACRVREIIIQDCWGLVDAVFSAMTICRLVRMLTLEGCSKVTTAGLERVVLQWREMEGLRVVSCNSIKDDEITPALSNLFYRLKELQWRPDSRSGLAGTGMRERSGRLIRRL